MGNVKEVEIQRAIRLKLGQLEDLVIWRNETGAYAESCTKSFLLEVLSVFETGNMNAAWNMVREAVKRGQWVSYGLCKGSADLIGIIKPSGRFFALELKTLTGKVTEEQALFLKLINNMGGYGAVARSVEEALTHYNAASLGMKAS